MKTHLNHINTGLNRSRQKRGQAMIEFCVGSLVLIILIAGLIQIGLLGMYRSETMQNATQRATLYSTADVFPGAVLPKYIGEMQEGNDATPYSEDDGSSSGNPAYVVQGILEHVRPSELESMVPENALSEAYHSQNVVTEYDLIQGKDVEYNIPLLPIIRKTVYAEDSIDVRSEVWMTWLKGLY